MIVPVGELSFLKSLFRFKFFRRDFFSFHSIHIRYNLLSFLQGNGDGNVHGTLVKCLLWPIFPSGGLQMVDNY